MKKLYAEQKHSLYELQTEIGVSRFTLYNFIGKPEKIRNIRYDTLVKIAKVEGIEPDILKDKMVEYAIEHPKERVVNNDRLGNLASRLS